MRIRYFKRTCSSLGSTPFLLYINEICDVSEIFKSVFFAIDTIFFCSGKKCASIVLHSM